MTNLAGEAIRTRCDDCVCVIVGFNGVSLDPDETPDNRNLTGFG
jgi:hypothetical protein